MAEIPDLESSSVASFPSSPAKEGEGRYGGQYA